MEDGSLGEAGEAGPVPQDGGHLLQDSGEESGGPGDGSPGGGDGAVGEDGAVGGDGASDASCGESGPSCYPADGFVQATMGPGPSSPPSTCQLGTTQSWLTVGSPAPGKPNVVANGGQQNGDPVQVICSVVPVNAGFDVSLQMTTEGSQGSSLTITSPPGLGAVTLAAGGQGITAKWQSATFSSAVETDCTIVFTYEGQPVPNTPTIAAGRVWGHLSCPQAVFNETVMDADGGTTALHCDGEADFLFEQCAQ